LIKRSASTSSLSSSESLPLAHLGRTSNGSLASSTDSLLVEQERSRKKQLMAQQMAKLAARSMHINVASTLFGGVSAGMAILPLLPYLAACCVM